jgi:hypothetical protein
MLPATVTIPIEVDRDHSFTVARDQLRFFDADGDGPAIPAQPL